MKHTLAEIILLVAIAPHCIALGLPPAEPDPHGIVIKPIPQKLVVLTFDDSCRSHATVVAPILKSLGFSGTFYVCDFDSFHTRKDWYLTWRQMKAMAADGFEIGNHTMGHAGGARIGSFLGMEDELLANNVPKPTTICWPMYQVNTGTFPDLAANGYIFGRGGHSRAYRPTVDNPFDVPSLSVHDNISVETFIRYVQKATHGRIVVITFHGVPDGEHPSVGLEPATFKVMMQYLKDNNYKGIALRDLAKYIDPVRAAKLPPTANNVKEAGAALSIKDDKPCLAVAKDIRTFAFPGLPPVSLSKTAISVTVPYATDVTALAPTCTLSTGATIAPASGTSRDFSKPQTYTVTGQDGSTKTYTVTVNETCVSTAKDMLTFVLPGSISAAISGTSIGAYVPTATDVTALAPTFTLPPFAKAVPASGTARDFTKPQTYTITAQDGSTQVCTVTVVKSGKPNSFTWSGAAAGNWSDASKWTNNLGAGSAPNAAGQPDYVLNFNMSGKYTVTNDLNAGFLLNQLNLGNNSLTLAGTPIAFTTNSVTGNLPQIGLNIPYQDAKVTAPVKLASDVAVGVIDRGYMSLGGLISGTGSLIKNGSGTLKISNATNTYSGGTIINSGKLYLFVANKGLGTGPVTLNDGANLTLEHVDIADNPLILNGGTIDANNGFGDSWNGDIVLNGNTRIAAYAGFHLNKISGGMSGPGGFTQIGPQGAFSRVNSGWVFLWGTNTYTGPTTVLQGTLIVKKAASLYNADTANWTPAKISVATAAKLRISVGGTGELTGAQAGTLLKNLAAKVNNNGLMAGSVFCLDTANAKGTVTLPATIADSKGLGGGAFVLKKLGAGTLQLSGANTYTGQTIVDGGTLSVASFNRVVGGKPSSSLGAPTTPDNGEIVFGNRDGNGDCALVYTGTGETTDREMNFAGKTFTATFDQSGTGLLKFTSTFTLSGYGHNKTIVLRGSTAGTGEIAGNIVNPYDRAGAATTALTKSGSGTWTLSGANRYTGPTLVTKGTLSLANERSLGSNTDVTIDAGATLELNFKGQMRVGKLTLDGKQQSAGTYSATDASAFIKGTGILIARQ